MLESFIHVNHPNLFKVKQKWHFTWSPNKHLVKHVYHIIISNCCLTPIGCWDRICLDICLCETDFVSLPYRNLIATDLMTVLSSVGFTLMHFPAKLMSGNAVWLFRLVHMPVSRAGDEAKQQGEGQVHRTYNIYLLRTLTHWTSLTYFPLGYLNIFEFLVTCFLLFPTLPQLASNAIGKLWSCSFTWCAHGISVTKTLWVIWQKGMGMNSGRFQSYCSHV